MWSESIELQHNEERNADSDRKWEERVNYDEHEPTTFERAQYNEEIEQDIYERDSKMGAI